jgi:hypothetical protein
MRDFIWKCARAYFSYPIDRYFLDCANLFRAMDDPEQLDRSDPCGSPVLKSL